MMYEYLCECACIILRAQFGLILSLSHTITHSHTLTETHTHLQLTDARELHSVLEAGGHQQHECGHKVLRLGLDDLCCVFVCVCLLCFLHK